MDKQLDIVKPIKFKNTFLIPIKTDISKLFGTSNIQFQISIKENMIVLQSPKILADLDIQDKHLIKETINVN